MRVLIISEVYRPQIGGIERMADLLLESMIRLGHDVRILTSTPEQVVSQNDGHIFRSPSLLVRLRLFLWADIVVANHISLRTGLFELMFHPRLIVWLHANPAIAKGAKTSIKMWLLKRRPYYAVSRYLLTQARLPNGRVMPNCYDEKNFFHEKDRQARRYDGIFVGRLIDGKRPGLFLEAMSSAQHAAGRPLKGAVIGDGPLMTVLKQHALEEKLDIDFLGELQPSAVADHMRQSTWLLIPSWWGEAFGLVALEGLACGCRVICTDDGGLPEAVGDCAFVVGGPSSASFCATFTNAYVAESHVSEQADSDKTRLHLAAFRTHAFDSRWAQALVENFGKCTPA